jgi:molybdate transport system substrate-binding protein
VTSPETKFIASFVVILGLLFAITGCGNHQAATEGPKVPPEGGTANRGELRIAAAADLKFALPELVAAFERIQPRAKISVTYGSSGTFFAQLSQEAPFDLFLSADIDYPKKLVEQGRGAANSAFEYATGHIVLWVPRESALDVENQHIGILRDPAVQKIAVANPKAAPYGRAAVAALESLGVYGDVQPRLVYGENVAQTAQMVESGAADAGIVAQSLAVSPAMREKGRWWRIPDGAHPPIVQGGVILSWARDPTLAGEFRDFLLSGAGAAVFRRFGFKPAGE